MGMFLSSWYKQGIFYMGVSSPAFRKKRGGESSLFSFVFHVSLVQNNQLTEEIWATESMVKTQLVYS
jgi:hypothetical protein